MMYDYKIDLVLLFDESEACAADIGAPSFVYYTSGQLALFDEDGNVAENIGTFSATLVNAEASSSNGYSLSYLFDHDAYIYRYFEDLYDPRDESFKVSVKRACNDQCMLNRNLLIIDDIVVIPEHRGHGVGLLALRYLMERLGMGVTVVALEATPLQFAPGLQQNLAALTQRGLDRFTANEAKATNKLRKHFGQLGFNLVSGCDIMVRSLEHRLPPHEALVKDAA